MKTLVRLIPLLAIVLLTSSPAAGADAGSGAPPGPGEPSAAATPRGDGAGVRTYGVASAVSHTVGAYAFDPFTSAQTYSAMIGTGDRFLTNGGTFLAPVNIPAGALITSMEIQGCDTSAAGQVTARFFSNTTSGAGVQSEITHGTVGTGVAATPGCDFFFAPFGTPVFVDNFNRTYYIDLTTDTTDGSNRFSAVRLYYVLQVSPAPTSARFNDVPTTHLFFRFIEALADAGITGGCSTLPPLYCPDDPVTRGQMAVFISRALGLHFVP